MPVLGNDLSQSQVSTSNKKVSGKDSRFSWGRKYMCVSRKSWWQKWAEEIVVTDIRILELSHLRFEFQDFPPAGVHPARTWQKFILLVNSRPSCILPLCTMKIRLPCILLYMGIFLSFLPHPENLTNHPG